VRAVVAVRAQDPELSFASLDLAGKHLLRRKGTEAAEGLRVVWVGEDRVWLERSGALCQATVFGKSPPPAEPAPPAAAPSGVAAEIARKVARTGPNEVQVDRSALDRILEAEAELMKTPLVPEKEGDRVVGFRMTKIRPGSILATLGFESNDRLVAIDGAEVTSMERMMSAYARLKTGTVERLTVQVLRGGKPRNIDFVIR
jgi:general secretion pathway protein C